MTPQRDEILQFGTSRFLLAHVDYYVSRSLAEGHSHKRVVVTQTSSRPEGIAKARALAAHRRYPVHFRGVRDGETFDRQEMVDSLATCLIAQQEWPELERRFRDEITHVVSNAGDNGYRVTVDDSPRHEVPASFPAKLAKLLYARYRAGAAGVILMPCELVSGNGQYLKTIVTKLSSQAYADAGFTAWLDEACLWIDTLVDRIVSSTLEPVGAVAEPYGLWAIQETPGLELPCHHPDVQRVDDIFPYEKRKLHILNLSHTWLVQRTVDLGLSDEIRFVREAMDESRLRDDLETLLEDEVLPTLDHAFPGMALADYKATVLERFTNPFLDHALVDIAQNHVEKVRRRWLPVHEMARAQGQPTPRLTARLEAMAMA
ncbi:tagaturonate reductase [Modicisalibacter ilicicola DSM 19980]|uniref:Tagaturonate reductase n=1 Tax=Modicisalibacter ilicicola DSM 19980 TaxID=1121942 RepID=A0A1M4ZNP9_9GAMM|nr:mannitol dehydrogenase [Halomonas ilicicola]SHF19628.1 tagaturonate reductase [Halomonas ilicicola DSM 19980]